MYPYCLVVQRREVADGAHLKVESEELLGRESLAAVEAAAASFASVGK